MDSTVLTIGIPTFNRSSLLAETIKSACDQAEQYDLVNEVEIVVSDNASTDDTSDVVRAIQATTPVRIHYHRNDVNVGIVKNIIQTLTLASGRFWMFYGDDDLVAEGALPRLVAILRSDDLPAALLFRQRYPFPNLGPSSERRLTIQEVARDYYYYIGNAGLLALETAVAQKALVAPNSYSFQTWWPVTELAFLAMAASGESRPMLSVPIDSAVSPHHADNTIHSAWYELEVNVFSLYHSALSLRERLGDEFFRAASDHVFRPTRLLGVAKAAYLHSALHDPAEDSQRARQATRLALSRAHLRARPALLALYLMLLIPTPIKVLAMRAYLLARHGFSGRAEFLAHQQRAADLRRRRGNPQEDKRPRIYTPADL